MPGIDINYFMRQARQLTQKLETRKAELAQESLTGTAGGDLVTVTVNGAQEVKGVKINPKAVEPLDLAMLEDLIVAATNQALTQSRDRMKTELEKISGGVTIPGLT
jgi:DNA-binding YbaB/EbfC family protein